MGGGVALLKREYFSFERLGSLNSLGFKKSLNSLSFLKLISFVSFLKPMSFLNSLSLFSPYGLKELKRGA